MRFAVNTPRRRVRSRRIACFARAQQHDHPCGRESPYVIRSFSEPRRHARARTTPRKSSMTIRNFIARHERVRAERDAYAAIRQRAQIDATDESTCKPGSVSALAHRVAAIHLDLLSPAGSSGLPAGSGGPPSNTYASRLVAQPTLLDLAPGGVYLAVLVTQNAGGLLHRRFTLTGSHKATRRSVLCGTVPRVAPGCR